MIRHIKIWIQNNIIVTRKHIASAMLLLLITFTAYVYTSGRCSKLVMDVVMGPWLKIAALISLSMVFEVKIPDSVRKYCAIFMLVIMPAIAFYSVESFNENTISEKLFVVVAANYIIYLMIYLIFYIITNRVWGAIALGNVSVFSYMAMNYYVFKYRGNPIRAYDVLAAKTAAGVAGQYEINLTLPMIEIMLYFWVTVLIALKIRWKEKNWRKRIVADVVLAGVILGVVQTTFNKEFVEKYNLKPDSWYAEESIKKHGLLCDFAAGIPYLKIEAPEGYSAKKAEEIQSEAATLVVDESVADETIKPDVIAIMNESFSDLRVLGDIQVSQEYLDYFYSLSENVVRGNMYVPVRGGLTCNTEFEFMTGYNCAFLPDNSIAYQTVIRSGTANLGAEFGNEGYYTTFFHPYYEKGWNRNSVYQTFGFDTSVYLEDLEVEESDLFRMYMTDEADYKTLIQLYEEQKAEQENVFMFNVTMQNHGGYLWRTSEVQVLSPEGDMLEANEYLSLINRSDKAFKELITYFEQVETPTVILMFGDHQPILTEFGSTLATCNEENPIARKMQEYCVPFIIWANYDIEEKVYDEISSNYLSIILKEVSEQPLTDYQKYLKVLMDKYPVVTNRGVKDINNNWYTIEEAKQIKEIQEYNIVQYWNLND